MVRIPRFLCPLKLESLPFGVIKSVKRKRSDEAVKIMAWLDDKLTVVFAKPSRSKYFRPVVYWLTRIVFVFAALLAFHAIAIIFPADKDAGLIEFLIAWALFHVWLICFMLDTKIEMGDFDNKR